MSNEQPQIMMPNLCQKHRVLLVRQTGFGPNDSWLVLEIGTQIALFQGATCDPKVYEEIGGDVTQITKIGCLACRKPDLFGQIVDAAQKAGKAKAVEAIKALGEKWIADSRKT
jgi:hypothetical protein